MKRSAYIAVNLLCIAANVVAVSWARPSLAPLNVISAAYLAYLMGRMLERNRFHA